MLEKELIKISMFSPKRLKHPDSWLGHLPLAAWLTREIKPNVFVELGTHSGNSYFAFCQAVLEGNLSTKCYAVDTWKGDIQAGYYDEEVFNDVHKHNQENYSQFSSLMRMSFDDAVTYFADKSIDLLHIDGLHTYEDVKHDFETWLPKLTEGAVILFHDISIREKGFGVWRLWEELREMYPQSIEFLHSNGLGIIQLDSPLSERRLSWLSLEAKEEQNIKDYFSALGMRQIERYKISKINQLLMQLEDQTASLNQIISEQSQQKDQILAEHKLTKQHISNLENTINQKDQILAEHELTKQHTSNLESIINQKDQIHQSQLISLKNLLESKDKNIESLEQQITRIENDVLVSEKNLENEKKAVQDKERHINNIELQNRNLQDEGNTQSKYIHYIDNFNKNLQKKLIEATTDLDRIQNGRSLQVTKALRNRDLKLFVSSFSQKNIEGSLDLPKQFEITYKSIFISGWATVIEGKVVKVEVFLDHTNLGELHYGISRPDVLALFPLSKILNCGFEGRIDINQSVGVGIKTLKILVTDSKGSQRSFCRSIVFEDVSASISLLTDVNTVIQSNSTDLASDVSYLSWIVRHEPSSQELLTQRRSSGVWRYRPFFSIITPVYKTSPELIKAAIESVRNQSYENWELCLVDGGSDSPTLKNILTDYANQDARIKVKFLKANLGIVGNSNEAIKMATGEFLALLDHDDELTPNALYENALLLNHYPNADFIYSDEDKLDENNSRCMPFFKPDWSPDLFKSIMYTCHLGVYRASLVSDVGNFHEGFDGSQDHDLVLRIIEKTDRIYHIPKILYHWRMTPGSTALDTEAKSYTEAARIKALQRHCERRGLKATVQPGLFSGAVRLKYTIDDNPLISIIIPTRDNGKILCQCIDSILKLSNYQKYEILIVDNNSVKADTLSYLASLSKHENISIIRYAGEFNFSAINNFAVTKAKGEILLFLNDDTQVISPEWLEAMLEHIGRPEVGAVGARLLYPNNTVQHSGVILGMGGVAGHAHVNLPRDHAGYFGRAKLIQNFSAVTGACMMTKASVFRLLKGFNEKDLAVAFNDIDYCLRLREKGFLIVYTPYAELYHHESLSRGSDVALDKIERFKREIKYMETHWRNVIKADPYYNINLSLELPEEVYSLAHNSRNLGSIYLKKDDK